MPINTDPLTCIWKIFIPTPSRYQPFSSSHSSSSRQPAGSSAPPLPWRPCCCSPCLDEEQPCPPCSALLVFHPTGSPSSPARRKLFPAACSHQGSPVPSLLSAQPWLASLHGRIPLRWTPRRKPTTLPTLSFLLLPYSTSTLLPWRPAGQAPPTASSPPLLDTHSSFLPWRSSKPPWPPICCIPAPLPLSPTPPRCSPWSMPAIRRNVQLLSQGPLPFPSRL
jgi:hypothetical protein